MSQKSLLNNNKSSVYFTNINSKKFEYYRKAKINSNTCKTNPKCKGSKSNTTKKDKAREALYRLSSTYKKKIISMLTTTFGFIRSDFKKKEIEYISKYLNVLNKVYDDYMCESGITKSYNTDIYNYFKAEMIKLDVKRTTQIGTFIDNIKKSNPENFQTSRYSFTSYNNTKSKTNSNSNTIIEYNMNNDTTLTKYFKIVLEKLPDCRIK